MPDASPGDAGARRSLADALDELMGTEYEQQVFVWVDGAPDGHSLDVVHSDDPIDGEPLPTTTDLPGGPTDGALDDRGEAGDDAPFGRYLVYVGYVPGPPFVERGVPVPPGTLLIDDDGAGATVALPPLPVAAVIDVLDAWARSLLGGEAAGDLMWSTTLDEDGEDEEDEDDDW